MIANEYMRSLELVREKKSKSSATFQDLKMKYDALFSKSQNQILISTFKGTLKKIEKNPNFGLQRRQGRYCVYLWIPRGDKNLYGSHRYHAQARKAVLMIADEYMKSLQDEKLKSPATFHQLKLKYDAMFGRIQNVPLNHKSPQKPNQVHEGNGTTQDDSELTEM